MLALQTMLLIAVDLLHAPLNNRLVQRRAATHSELVPVKSVTCVLLDIWADLLLVLLDLLRI